MNDELLEKNDKTPEDYERLFKRAHDFDSKRYTDYRDLMAFYEGKQDLLAQYSGEKPWVVDITTPYASDAIGIRVASLLANDYVGEIEPLSPEDVDIIHDLNMVYNNIWKEMNMDNVISQSILRSAVVREAYAHIIYNKGSIRGGTNRKTKGRLEAFFLPPEAVLIDPNALDFKEADYIVVVDRISYRKLKEKYKNLDFDRLKKTQDTTEERGEMYAGNDYETEQEDVYTRKIFYEMMERDTPEQHIVRTVVIGNQFAEKPSPMDIRYYPVAQLRWEKRMKSCYGISLMDKVLPLQKSINAIESAITNTALQFAAPSFIVSVDSGLDPRDVAVTAGAPGIVLPVEGSLDNAIRPLFQGRTVDQNMIGIKQENENTIYKIVGITDQFQGDLGTGGNTSTGSEQVVQRAKIIEQQVLQNIEEYVEDLTHIIVDFILKTKAGETFYMRSQKRANGTFEFTNITIPSPEKALDYTFAINLDVKTPYSKERTKSLLRELYQQERQYQAPVKVIQVKDILKFEDVPNRDELVTRYDNLVTKDNQSKAEVILELTTAAQQNQIAPEMLQAAIVEILSDAEKTPTLDQVISQIETNAANEAKMQEKQAQEQQNLEQKQKSDQMKLENKEMMDIVNQQASQIEATEGEIPPSQGGIEAIMGALSA